MQAAAPSFAHHFGIRPWELDKLTIGEVVVLFDWLNTQAEMADPESRTNQARKQNTARSRAAAQSLLR